MEKGLKRPVSTFTARPASTKFVNDELVDVNNSKLSGAFAESEMRTRRAIADDAMDLYSGCHKIESDLAEASKAVKELFREANDIFNSVCAAGGHFTADGNVYDADQNYKINVDYIYKSGRNLWEGISDANQKLNAMVALCIRKAKDIIKFVDNVYSEIIQLNKKAKGTKVVLKGKITNLFCGGNKLTALNVQGLNALQGLYCEGNQLTALNVQGCTSLQYLYCNKNQLTADAFIKLFNDLPQRTVSQDAWCCLYTEQSGATEGNHKDFTSPGELKTAFDNAKTVKNWKMYKYDKNGYNKAEI